MTSFVVAMVAGSACGGGAPTRPVTTARDLDLEAGVRSASKRAPPRVALDPILGLGDPTERAFAWITPAQARLEIAGTPIEVAQPLDSLAVPTTILDEQGSLIRVAVRLPHARFSLWTEQQWLFAIVQSTTRVTIDGVFGTDRRVEVSLAAGARVRVIKRVDARALVRYVGEVELEGWIPNEVLGDEWAEQRRERPMMLGTWVHVVRGAVIRSEPTWGSARLALMNKGYRLIKQGDLPGNWMAVSYADSDVAVRGYYQHRSPPERTTPSQIHPDVASPPIAPTATARGGTCLYARPRGEPIGYLVGDQLVALEATRDNTWWSVVIDTPWGQVMFFAQGPDAANLATCMPVAAATAPTSP